MGRVIASAGPSARACGRLPAPEGRLNVATGGASPRAQPVESRSPIHFFEVQAPAGATETCGEISLHRPDNGRRASAPPRRGVKKSKEEKEYFRFHGFRSPAGDLHPWLHSCAPPARRSRRGFLMLDVSVALVVVTILTVALAITMGHQRRAMTRLSDTRQAIRLAEQALAELQRSGATALGGEDIDLKLVPAEGPDAPTGWRWMRVAVTYRRGAAELTGLIPASPEGGRP